MTPARGQRSARRAARAAPGTPSRARASAGSAGSSTSRPYAGRRIDVSLTLASDNADPGGRRLRRRRRDLARRRLDLVRGRPRRLAPRRRAARQRAQPERLAHRRGVLGAAHDRRDRPLGARTASPRSSTSWPGSSARTRSPRRARSSTTCATSASRWRTRRGRSTRAASSRTARPRAPRTPSSPTSSRTSGSATSSRSRSWQHIWLNEGFATYAEWLWGESRGRETAQQRFNQNAARDARSAFWDVAIGTPGKDNAVLRRRSTTAAR